MIKKLTAVLLAICLFLCGCGDGDTPSLTGTDLGFAYHSTAPKEQVLTEDVSLRTAWRNGVLRSFARPDTQKPLTFDWLNNQFPLQCTRTPTANSAYCLYRTEEGGYLYVFFDKQDTDYAYSHWAYMQRRLPLSAFEHLQTGDLRDEVYMVDPGLRTLVQSAQEYPLLIQWSAHIDKEYSYSFHILEDGLLTIRYDEEDRIQQMIVKDDYLYTIKAGDRSKTYNFVIFADDFAPATTANDPSTPMV